MITLSAGYRENLNLSELELKLSMSSTSKRKILLPTEEISSQSTVTGRTISI